jgi:hypothetical protein
MNQTTLRDFMGQVVTAHLADAVGPGPESQRRPRVGLMHPGTALRALVATVSTLGVMVAPAAATDGRTSISQSRAIAGNVTPGDAAGFPVTISRPGSYVLTGNLTVPNANTTAIEITADDVTLDLNGFAILGPTVCLGGQSGLCPGTGNGVFSDFGVDNVTVVNGTVRGMGRNGIALTGFGNRVERIQARSNGRAGISAGSMATVTGNRAMDNGDDGIVALGGSVVAGNVVFRNLGTGIVAGNGTTITNNAAWFNAGSGIFANAGSIVIGNVAHQNTEFGLETSVRTGYSQNAFTDNGGLGAETNQVSRGINGGHNVCGNDAICP